MCVCVCVDVGRRRKMALIVILNGIRFHPIFGFICDFDMVKTRFYIKFMKSEEIVFS